MHLSAVSFLHSHFLPPSLPSFARSPSHLAHRDKAQDHVETHPQPASSWLEGFLFGLVWFVLDLGLLLPLTRMAHVFFCFFFPTDPFAFDGDADDDNSVPQGIIHIR